MMPRSLMPWVLVHAQMWPPELSLYHACSAANLRFFCLAGTEYVVVPSVVKPRSLCGPFLRGPYMHEMATHVFLLVATAMSRQAFFEGNSVFTVTCLHPIPLLYGSAF